MKQKLAFLRNRSAQYAAAGSALVMAGMQSAHAELPAAATTAFTTINTDGLALIDLAWVPVIGITAGFIIIKLFKRAANKVG